MDVSLYKSWSMIGKAPTSSWVNQIMSRLIRSLDPLHKHSYFRGFLGIAGLPTVAPKSRWSGEDCGMRNWRNCRERNRRCHLDSGSGDQPMSASLGAQLTVHDNGCMSPGCSMWWKTLFLNSSQDRIYDIRWHLYEKSRSAMATPLLSIVADWKSMA